ncbi:uncharacterized protein SCHCODRAFT_02663814 [Schizophyllum commune H4-8]|uniref:F-box domain-containing protein n=1 Tax=Schizophyllum commune (strain H4-8 / FGSC 9210) TaxID=578458 RepID=D8PYF0_SCHCM|nr:uncharacterized protein SCHCODRAFT_02663814 [Schizophyllum commune H4-8]KAI5895927.1 hypothetical protein SCHCODRAFT_02663814 [Schizophyllum commune H4-8]
MALFRGMPQEIRDHIVDLMSDDQSALAAIGSVHRSFTGRSQRLLFSDVTLTMSATVFLFHRAIQNTSLRGIVKVLHVRTSISGASWIAHDVTLPTVLTKLYGLVEFHFRPMSLCLSTSSPALNQAFYRVLSLPSLRVLEVIGVRSLLLSRIAGAVHLHDVRLAHVEFQDEMWRLERVSPPNLISLTLILDAHAMRRACLLLMDHEDQQPSTSVQLRRLRLDLVSSKDIAEGYAGAAYILSRCASCLRDLELGGFLCPNLQSQVVRLEICFERVQVPAVTSLAFRDILVGAADNVEPLSRWLTFLLRRIPNVEHAAIQLRILRRTLGSIADSARLLHAEEFISAFRRQSSSSGVSSLASVHFYALRPRHLLDMDSEVLPRVRQDLAVLADGHVKVSLNLLHALVRGVLKAGIPQHDAFMSKGNPHSAQASVRQILTLQVLSF